MTDADNITLLLSQIHDIEFCHGCRTWWFGFGDIETAPESAGQVRIAIGNNDILARALHLDGSFEPSLCTPCRSKQTPAGVS